MRRTLSILSLLAALPAALLAQGAGQSPLDSIAGLGAPRSADSLRRVIDQAVHGRGKPIEQTVGLLRDGIEYRLNVVR